MKWVSAFSYLPINYGVTLAQMKDQTQRVIFDNNLNGSRIRLRLSNRYSSKSLKLENVSVGLVREGKLQNVRMISRGGSMQIELKPGEECWSDELEYVVSAGDKIAVSIYVKEEQKIGSVCVFWSKSGASVSVSETGNYVDGSEFKSRTMEDIYSFVREDANKGIVFYGFTGFQILTEDYVKTITAFGDSITHMSYMTNALCRRLYSEYSGKVTLLNRGIGGNRVLHDASSVSFIPGGGSCFGNAGIRRFEQDVFGEEQTDIVLVLEGINDIMHPCQFGHPDEKITAVELEKGYECYIKIARQHQAKILGGTIMPCANKEYPSEWMKEFEGIRCSVNKRIREGFGYDGYADYDEVLTDEKHSSYMKKEYHMGDGLHPNEAGGEIMADIVMKLLSEKCLL